MLRNRNDLIPNPLFFTYENVKRGINCAFVDVEVVPMMLNRNADGRRRLTGVPKRHCQTHMCTVVAFSQAGQGGRGWPATHALHLQEKLTIFLFPIAKEKTKG